MTWRDCLLSGMGVLLAACCLAAPVDSVCPKDASAPEPRRRLTPVMGWSSWNSFGRGITYARVKSQMDAIVSLGLKDYGWEFINIDDCYQDGRDPKTGRLRIDLEKFPNGYADMKALADYAHSLGLKAGIYSDGGDNACSSGGGSGSDPKGRDVGLYRHETDDLNIFLGDGVWRDAWAKAHPEDPGVECWGYDFIKIDWCGGGHARLNDAAQYGKIMDAIESVEARCGKDKIVNICRWAYVGPWQFRADSWRSGPDIDSRGDSWESVMVQVDIMKGVGQYTRPGSMNDPDMLIAGLKLTAEEDKSHFAMWCMFSSPLLIGQDLRKIKPETLALYKNAELIALNQDPAVLSAIYLGDIVPGVEIWVKMLGDDRSPVRALAIFNRTVDPQTVTLDYRRLGYVGRVLARDLFAHADLPPAFARTVTLPPHGIDVLRLKPADGQIKVLMPSASAIGSLAPRSADVESRRRLDWANALRKVQAGAVLLDVRTRAEFDAGHADGAEHLPYTRLFEDAKTHLPDTNRTVVCYCKRYKRAAQAATTLDMLGYRNVFFVGDGLEAYANRPRAALADVKAFVSDIHTGPWDRPWPMAKGKPDVSWKGKPITICGKTYAKGVGTRADVLAGGNIIVCDVPENADCFVAMAGFDETDRPDRPPEIAYEVKFDGRVAASSPVLGRGEDHLFVVRVPAGAKKMWLVSRGEPSGCCCSWGGAGFTLRERPTQP